MTNKKKVIKGLELCINENRDCTECPYNDGLFCADVLMRDALSMIKKLEPHVIELSEIEDGGGYWLTTMSSNFKPRPVICVHNEKDAIKPYVTLAGQYGTFSWETETYGIEWHLWSANPEW